MPSTVIHLRAGPKSNINCKIDDPDGYQPWRVKESSAQSLQQEGIKKMPRHRRRYRR